MRNARRDLSRVIAGLALCFACACQKSHQHAGSESHFLTLCTSSAECGELSCHAGVCTTACTSDGACGAVGAASECAGTPGGSAESAPERICDVVCEEDATCLELAGHFTCHDGRCRAGHPPQPRADAGSAADAGASSTAGSGGPGILEPQPNGPNTLDAGAPVPIPPTGCRVESPFLGNDICLLAPPADRGLQIHVGPSRYDDPAELEAWVIEPGEEIIDDCWSFHTPNDTDVVYAEWEFSARPGLHHVLNTIYGADVADGAFEVCRDNAGPDATALGDLPSANRQRIARTALAPENADLGWSLEAHARAQARLHQFNFTDVPLLREFWMNLYLPDSAPAEVARPLRASGGVDWIIEPQAELVERFEWPIDASGRLLSLTGHILPGTLRLTAWLRRASGERQQVLEVLETNEPIAYRFDTVTLNPPIMEPSGGAHSGMLAVEPGDALEWECHVFNETANPLTHVDDATAGAICNLTGATVGVDIDAALP
jgi:hypothetical protein